MDRGRRGKSVAKTKASKVKAFILKRRRQSQKWRIAIKVLDNLTCRNPHCIGSEFDRLFDNLSCHHIEYDGQGGADTKENCITLCRACDYAVHNGLGNEKTNDRVVGRAYMLRILDQLEDDSDYRWHEAHKKLRRIYG